MIARAGGKQRRTLPCIAVTGEARSGKSSLINTLLGLPGLPTGFDSRVRPPVLVSHASKPSLALENNDHRRVATNWAAIETTSVEAVRWLRLGLPADMLRLARLLETTAFASGDDSLDLRTQEMCGRAHAGIWCTPAMQAWKASERDAWLTLPERFQVNGILAVTYVDAIPSQRDRERLSARLRVEAAPYFGRIIMVANNEATGTRQAGCRIGVNPLAQTDGSAELRLAVRALIGA